MLVGPFFRTKWTKMPQRIQMRHWWPRAQAAILILVVAPGTVFAQPPAGDRTFADRLEYVGHALEDARYHVWGASPVQGPKGRTHLFVARWPRKSDHQGWHISCEIARYVGDDPKGPFQFAEVVLTSSRVEGRWDKLAPHNPHIQKVGSRYALFFIANEGRENFPANQHIGLAVADSLTEEFERVGETGRILSPPAEPSHWAHSSPVGVNNPSLLRKKRGRFYLYYKARQDSSEGPARQMGLAVAKSLTGPYEHRPDPVTANEQMIEDGYAFLMDGEIRLLTTDTRGQFKKGGGVLWASTDGKHFARAEPGYYRLQHYLPEGALPQPAVDNAHRTPGTLERPQILRVDGKPRYLYLASGTNLDGGPVSVNYVFRIESK